MEPLNKNPDKNVSKEDIKLNAILKKHKATFKPIKSTTKVEKNVAKKENPVWTDDKGNNISNPNLVTTLNNSNTTNSKLKEEIQNIIKAPNNDIENVKKSLNDNPGTINILSEETRDRLYKEDPKIQAEYAENGIYTDDIEKLKITDEDGTPVAQIQATQHIEWNTASIFDRDLHHMPEVKWKNKTTLVESTKEIWV